MQRPKRVPASCATPIPWLKKLRGNCCAAVNCIDTSFAVSTPSEIRLLICRLPPGSVRILRALLAGPPLEARRMRALPGEDAKRQHYLETLSYYGVTRFPNGILLKAPKEFVSKVKELIAELEG